MEVNAAVTEKEAILNVCNDTVGVAVKAAVCVTKSVERHNQSRAMEKEKIKSVNIKAKLDDQNTLVTELLNQSIFAERATKKAKQEAS